MSATLVGACFYVPIPKAEKLVLLALADHANDDGAGVWAGNHRLSIKTSDSTRNVRRLLPRLEAANLIARVKYPHGGRGKAVEWEINAALVYEVARANGWTQQTRTPSAMFTKNKDAQGTKGGHDGSQSRRKVSTQPSLTINNRDDFQIEEPQIPKQDPGETTADYLARVHSLLKDS